MHYKKDVGAMGLELITIETKNKDFQVIVILILFNLLLIFLVITIYIIYQFISVF